jgi:hypothetical protein
LPQEQLNDRRATGDQEYKIAHSVCSLHNAAASSNESVRRVANSPSDHLLPSSKDHNESRDPDSLIEEQRRHISHPSYMEPGVLGQNLFDVCVPKNVEGCDVPKWASIIDFCPTT